LMPDLMMPAIACHPRVDARQSPSCRAGSGRKTDIGDAAWLCQFAEAVLHMASFVPPKPLRDLRLLNRSICGC
jgi:hypothetical protein